MSIFEPIQRESRADAAQDVADATGEGTEPAPAGGWFDPRSIKIAGFVVAALVVAGVVVSNMAEPADTRPLVAKRVDPGAAAVEQAEASQADGGPTIAPSVSPSASASASAEPVESDSDRDEPEFKVLKQDEKPGKPGKGHGRGRD